MASQFPATSVDSFATVTDGVTTVLAAHQNDRAAAIVSTQTKVGVDADPVSATTLEGRAKFQETGGLKRGSSVASATSITLAAGAQVFPITGTTTIATITSPGYARLVYLEFASALTLTHGSGNLTMPGATDLAVPAGAVLALEWTGSTWQVVGGGGGTLSNPMTTLDDVIVGAASGVPTRLAKGGDGQVLTVDPSSHHVAWANSASGFANPMVAQDDVIIGGSAGTATRLAKGTDGQVLTVDPVTHHLLWATPTALTNPMTTAEDVIVGGVSGAPARLAKGGDGQVLTIDPTSHGVAWANSASGFANPMVAQDDLIVGGSAGTGTRLAKGTDGQVLTVDPSTHHLVWRTIPTFGVGQDGIVTGPGSVVAGQFLASSGAWATPSGSGMSNPMTTAGDLITGGSSGTPGRLAIGSTGDVLTVSGGAPVWAAPAGGGGGGSLLWDPYGLAVPPVATDLSVHDHWSGSGILTTLDQEGDAVVFKNPAAGAIIERGAFGTTSGPLAVPTPPYTATLCLIPNIPMVQYWSCQLALRQSSNDKRITARVVFDNAMKLDGINWTDYQTVSASFGSLTYYLGFPVWIRIRDDGGTRYWEYSQDGKWWMQLTSGSSGAHCTPDQAGITMDSIAGGSGGLASMTVLSLSVVNTA